jgi:nucleoside diphosphate kinase
MLLDGRYCLPFPDRLTNMPDKAALFSLDPYFWEGWEDLNEIAGPLAIDAALTHSLILLRPDIFANRRAEVLLDWLPCNGFTLVDCLPLSIDRHQIRALWQYQWNIAVSERKGACDALMEAGSSLLLIVRTPGGQRRHGSAAAMFAHLKGSADPAQRRPGDLRAILAHKSRMLSFIHSPDEAADFIRELAIFLDPADRRAVLERIAAGAVASIEQAKAEVISLYRQMPEHSLELETTLTRIERSARETIDPKNEDYNSVVSWAQRARDGARVDWRDLFAILDRHAVAYAPWDRVAIAGHVITMDLGGKAPLLGHPPRGNGGIRHA